MANTLPIVVSASSLKSALDGKTPKLVVLDATWIPQVPMEGMAEVTGIGLYESKHIPSARHFDMDACITKTQFIPRNLPKPAEFQAYLRGLGISEDSHVVFYDRDDGKVIITAAAPRACFVLKLYGHSAVSVLDGGFVNWEALGYATESGPAPKPQTGNVVVNLQSDLIVDFDKMRQIEKSGNHQIVDTRFAVNFNGEEEEPCDFMKLMLTDAKLRVPKAGEVKKGHMRNAVNIPFPSIFKDSVSFKTKEDLIKLFKDHGVDFSKPTVATCYIGHTAAMLCLLVSYCGFDNVKLYYGSWTEYCQRTADKGKRSPKKAPEGCIIE